MQRYVEAPVGNLDVGEMTPSNIRQFKRPSTNNLRKIISYIKFLGEKYSCGHKPKPQYINNFFYNHDHMFSVVSSSSKN